MGQFAQYCFPAFRAANSLQVGGLLLPPLAVRMFALYGSSISLECSSSLHEVPYHDKITLVLETGHGLGFLDSLPSAEACIPNFAVALGSSSPT